MGVRRLNRGVALLVVTTCGWSLTACASTGSDPETVRSGEVTVSGPIGRNLSVPTEPAPLPSGVSIVPPEDLLQSSAPASRRTDQDADRPGQDPTEGAVQALALLGTAAVSDDRLPTFGDEDETSGAGELSPGSARLIATVDSIGYFAGASVEGEVCIAVHLDLQVASSCTDLDRFSVHGVWVGGSNYLGYDVTALLLPDHLSDPDPGDVPHVLERAGIDATDGYEVLAPNLVAEARTNR